MNVLGLKANLERLPIETAIFANRTSHPDIRQEIHLQAIRAVAFACLAAATGSIETEPPGLVAANLSLGQLREQGTNLIKHFNVRRGVGARRAPDGRLIDVDYLVDLLDTGDSVMLAYRASEA